MLLMLSLLIINTHTKHRVSRANYNCTRVPREKHSHTHITYTHDTLIVNRADSIIKFNPSFKDKLFLES